MDLSDVGWVWEGQPAYTDFPPSIYGLGEGCRYFGLSKAYYLYHGNSDLVLAKLANVDEVVCDLSIWRYRKIEDAEGRIGWGIYHDKDPATIVEEARKVSDLSRQFPNLAGAMWDDFLGAVNSEGYGTELIAEVYAALKAENPALNLCSTIYTHELDPAKWEALAQYVDVVFLWTWESKNLFSLDGGVERCRELFPDKPIVLGCYLRDYTLQAPVPMDRLKYQWERLPGYLSKGLITGFCILGAYLIDWHNDNARWVRDFIAGN